jgi:hypothetical protein
LAVSIEELLGQNTNISVDGSLPILGEETHVNGSWTLEKQHDVLAGIEGGLSLTNVDIRTLPINKAPEALVSLNAQLVPHPNTLWAFEVVGRVYAEQDPYLDGPFSFGGDYRNEELAVNRIQWKTPDITLLAGAEYTSEAEIKIRLDEVRVEHEAAQLLVNQIEMDEAYFQAKPEALLSLKDTRMTVNADLEWKVDQGTVNANGLSLYRINDELLGESISASAKYQDDQLRIESLTDGNISIQGTLSPDFETNTFAFELQGNGDLEPKYWQTFTSAKIVSTLGGSIDLERASGTYIHGEGFPKDLFIEGTLQNGEVVLEQQGQLNTLALITARFSSSAEEIEMTLDAESSLSGPFEIDGTYAMEEKLWKGTVKGNIQEWANPYIDRDQNTSLIDAALAQLGTPEIRLEINLEKENQIHLALAMESEQNATLAGSLSLIEKDSGYILGDVQAESTLDSTHMADSLFENMYLEGPAEIRFNRSLAKSAFETDVNMDSVNVYLSKYIEKKPGDALKILVSGEAGDHWTLDSVRIDCLNEMLIGEYSDGTISIPKTTIQATNWMRLLPFGSTAEGSVQIGFSGETKETTMTFDSFGFRINKELQIDRINGELNFNNGIFQTPALHLLGANSDCTITAILEDDVWNGYLEGASLDLNAVNVFLDAGRAFTVKEETEVADGLPEESEPASYWERPYRIEAQIQLEEILYGRGRLEQISGKLRTDHTGIYFEDFVINPESGSLGGWASITPNEFQQDQLSLHAVFHEFDTRVLDTMLFDSTRELEGKITGLVEFQAPRGPIKEMLAAGNGHADWVAHDGTFGKMGFATKLLTALKTVNVINLRAPSMRDKGLTYTDFSGNAKMQNGVIQIHDTLLDETSYAMEIEGLIDYAKDETDVNVFVRVLESVTKLADKVPIIRKVAEFTTKKIGVNVVFSGSPYELEASAQTPEMAGGDGNPVNTTVKLGTDAVKGITNVITKPFKRNEKPDNDKP